LAACSWMGVPAVSCLAYRWAALACGTGITSEAPALRDSQIAEAGPGPREARWHPTLESNADHSSSFLGEFDQPSSAFRPASVILMRAIWIFRLPILMVWRCAVASPSWTRSANVLALTEDSQIGRRVRVCAYEDAGMHLAVS
jgi:hypothetical protein